MNREFEKVDIAKTDTIVEIKREELLRVVSAKELFATGYGDVGSSIFYALGVVVAVALGATPICLLIAGVFFIFIALSYRELSTTYLISGGSQLYARQAFGDFASFIAGWALLADYILTITISAYTAVSYMGAFYSPFKTIEYIHIFYTIFIIILLTFINITGVKKSAVFNVILAFLCLIITSVLVILAALLFFKMENLVNLINIGSISLTYKPTFKDFMLGVILAMVAYTGIESISQLGGEARNAKAMSKATIWVMIVVIVFSFAISFLAISAVPPTELKEKWHEDAVYGFALAVCNKIKMIEAPYFLKNYIILFAHYFPYAISILAILVLIVAANAGVIGGSRLMYSMSHSLQMPYPFRKLHKRFKTPYISIIAVSVISCVIMIFSKQLTILAELYIFGAVLAFLITHLALIVLRFKEKSVYRPYKTPFNIKIFNCDISLTAVTGSIITLCVLVSIYVLKPYGRIFGILWPLIGIPLYIYFRKKAHAPVVKAPPIEEIKFPEYKEPKVKNILICIKGIEDMEMVVAGCKLAKSFNANLSALYVIELPETLEIDEFENLYFKELPYLEEVMRRIKAIGTEHDILVDTLVYKSRSYATVVKEISSGYDLIIIGNTYKKTRGLSKTVEYLIKNLSVPVLVFSYKIAPTEHATLLPFATLKKLFKNT